MGLGWVMVRIELSNCHYPVIARCAERLGWVESPEGAAVVEAECIRFVSRVCLLRCNVLMRVWTVACFGVNIYVYIYIMTFDFR